MSRLKECWGSYVKKGEEKKKRKNKKEKRISGMDCYGFVWITMGLYGFVNFCMDSWILGLVLCLGFCYEKF